ncbi:MAG: hypothetical protein JXO51_03950 [Candidatus Aminicenantes bacterium]|nr:hypothetical protein [Candidatus Aminicenantes bacterium]
MKLKSLPMVLILAWACMAAVSCVTSGETGGNDDEKLPDFVQDSCAGCADQEFIREGGIVTGIRFFSYVKNTGGSGKISMSIASSGGNATRQFDVTAGSRYVFQASVPVETSNTSSFTYMAQFPGTPGYKDTHNVTGYRCTGAPYDLKLELK